MSKFHFDLELWSFVWDAIHVRNSYNFASWTQTWAYWWRSSHKHYLYLWGELLSLIRPKKIFSKSSKLANLVSKSESGPRSLWGPIEHTRRKWFSKITLMWAEVLNVDHSIVICHLERIGTSRKLNKWAPPELSDVFTAILGHFFHKFRSKNWTRLDTKLLLTLCTHLTTLSQNTTFPKKWTTPIIRN
jgi:hypothetical protein